MSPDNDRKAKPPTSEIPPKPMEAKEIETVQKENVKPDQPVEATSTEPTVKKITNNNKLLKINL